MLKKPLTKLVDEAFLHRNHGGVLDVLIFENRPGSFCRPLAFCLESLYAPSTCHDCRIGHNTREADKPKQLIAADFGHAHTFGRAYYVATRFFDRR